MFVVVVCGGPYDGEKIDIDGWCSFGATPVYKFDDYSDAQEFIMSRQARLRNGDYGKGATLWIDEWEGD